MWWLLTLIFGGIPLVIFILCKYYYGRNKDYWPKHGVPLLKLSDVAPLLDRMLFRQPFHEIELRMSEVVREKFGSTPYVGFMEFGKPTLILYDLDLVKAVLVKDFDHFVDRRTIDMKKADPYLHEMLINKQGQEWKNMRNTLSPTFSTGRIRRMFEVFNECSDKMTVFLNEEIRKKKESNDSEPIECRDVCSRYTMDVIANAAFGVDSKVFQDADAKFANMGRKIQNQLTGVTAIFKLIIAIFAPKLLNVLRISFFDKEASNFFVENIKSSIEYRNKTGAKRDDFLQLLIETASGELKPEDDKADDDYNQKNLELQKASKVHLTVHSMTAQSLLFFLAGFDTTETLLILALYELAVNPDVQEKLYQQIDEVLKRNDGKMTYEGLVGSQYLDMVVSETLRKYPPGIRLERKCTKDYNLPGTSITIRKDDVIIIPVMGIHYDEEIYPDPHKFDPERFTPENKANRHPYAYMPFGQGPRSCIAMRFALVEGKAAIANFVHNFELKPSSKTTIPLKFAAKQALKPEGGLWLNIKPRNK